MGLGRDPVVRNNAWLLQSIGYYVVLDAICKMGECSEHKEWGRICLEKQLQESN